MAAVQPLVYIVVLHWKHYDHTAAAISSILGNAYPHFRLIVVDNASQNGSVELLQREFPQLTFVLNQQNLGFAKGCNAGIRQALKNSQCEYVLLMNNDATIAKDSLEAAVRWMEKCPAIGIVGGKVLCSRSPGRISYAGGRIDYWRGQAVIRGFGELDRGQYNEAIETGFVTGALMLIRKRVLTEVGLLPEQYFFGVEEWHFSIQTRRAGFKLYYVPEFVARHAGDGSHWNYDPKFVYNSYRNKLMFQEYHLPRLLFAFWKPAFAFYGKYLARHARRRLIGQGLFQVPRPVQFDYLDFALAKAIKDHRKNELSESALISFEAELHARFETETVKQAPLSPHNG
jgi:GT2 family glycosyltransferase